MKFYINNFGEDLNYRKVVLYIGNVDLDRLYKKLKREMLIHLYRFEHCKENKLMFVENCDLQDVNTDNLFDHGNSLLNLIDDGYSVLTLYFDEVYGKYYINVDMYVSSK